MHQPPSSNNNSNVTVPTPESPPLPAYRYSLNEKLVYGSLGACLSVYITVVNLSILAMFTRDRRLQRVPGHTLIVWLMVTSDVMIGCCALPGYLVDTLSQPVWPLPMWACDLWILSDYVSTNVGVLSVTAVAFDRFLATNCVFAHKRWMHRENQLRLCLGLWLFTLARNILVFPVWALVSGFRSSGGGSNSHACSHPIYANTSAALAQRTVALYIPIGLLLFFYSAVVFRILRSRSFAGAGRSSGHGGDSFRKNVPCESASGCRQLLQHRRASTAPHGRFGKSFRTVTCVLASFLLANLPWHILDNLIMTGRSGIKKTDPVYILSWILCYANACLNPLFYPFMNNQYRTLLARAMRCRGQSRGRSCQQVTPPATTATQTTVSSAAENADGPATQLPSAGGHGSHCCTRLRTMLRVRTARPGRQSDDERQMPLAPTIIQSTTQLQVTECISSL